MEYKILEKIQNNLFTLVFLIKNSKKKYILKRKKILNKHIKKNLKYEIWREIDFSEFVNKLPKNKRIFFMQMYEYKIVENCDKKLFDKLPKIMLKDKIYKEEDEGGDILSSFLTAKNTSITVAFGELSNQALVMVLEKGLDEEDGYRKKAVDYAKKKKFVDIVDLLDNGLPNESVRA